MDIIFFLRHLLRFLLYHTNFTAEIDLMSLYMLIYKKEKYLKMKKLKT